MGTITGQPGRRLVRPAQWLPRPVRDVPPPAAGSARPRRGQPRPAQQPDAGGLRQLTAAMLAGHHLPGRARAQQATEEQERPMAVTKVIRYTTKPESADENERLIRDVFAELAASAAFGAFQSGIKDRCAEGPIPGDATAVGSYRLLPE